MAVGNSFLGQYSVFCVFGLVGGCVVVPLITQSIETMVFSALVVGLATVSKLQLTGKTQPVDVYNKKEKDIKKLKHSAIDPHQTRSRKRRPAQDPESVRRKREEEIQKAEDEQLKELERREEEKREKRFRKKQERQKRKEQEKIDKEKELQRLFRPRVGSMSNAQANSTPIPNKPHQSIDPTLANTSRTNSLHSSSIVNVPAPQLPSLPLPPVYSDRRFQPVAPYTHPHPTVVQPVRKTVRDSRPADSPADWNEKLQELTKPSARVSGKHRAPHRPAIFAPRTISSPLVAVEHVIDQALQKSIAGVAKSTCNTGVVAPLPQTSPAPCPSSPWYAAPSWKIPEPLPLPARKDLFEHSRVTPQPVATVNPTVRPPPTEVVYATKPHLSPELHKPAPVPSTAEPKTGYYSLFGNTTPFGSDAFGRMVSPTWHAPPPSDHNTAQYPW